MKQKYRNVFHEMGYSKEEIEKRIRDSFQTIFYGADDERFYHETDDGMGYLEDTGNHDVRTEGMSYGMMVCVQLDKKEEFDRIWKWTKKYMYMDSGIHKGYFGWSCRLDGTRNSDGPAPDGEEYFAMALFFASNRWGDGEGILEYGKEARAILKACVHNGENGNGFPMWNPENKLIKFIPELDITDPSYHLPHFYELFALWADEEDRDFWKQAARASREYLKKACHPVTGLSPEYSYYDGTPCAIRNRGAERHDWYYSDAYRTIGNIALDYEWFASDDWAKEVSNNLQKFFEETVKDNPFGVYEIDGTVIDKKALHPVAVTATNATASLAADGEYIKICVQKFWETPLRTGDRRYYDNFLYMFALLALSGNYKIYYRT